MEVCEAHRKWSEGEGGGNRGVGCLLRLLESSEGIRGHPYNYSTTTPPDSSCGLNVTQLAVRGQRLWTQHVICVRLSEFQRKRRREKWIWEVRAVIWKARQLPLGTTCKKKYERGVSGRKGKKTRWSWRHKWEREKINAGGWEKNTHTEEPMPKKRSTQHRYQCCSTAYGRGFWHWC